MLAVEGKMDIRQSMKIFWNAPELVERLFLFLDTSSVLHLAQAKMMNKQSFKESLSSKVWRNLIKQSPWDGVHVFELNEEEREGVRTLVKILKLKQPEDPSSFLLPLLDRICQRTSSLPWLAGDEVEMEIKCPCQEEPHKISMEGFQLLEEEVEGVFGTTLKCKHSSRLQFGS